MTRKSFSLALVVILLILSGCAQPRSIQTSVTRFHQFEQQPLAQHLPPGSVFHVKPADKTLSKSPEFQLYAKDLSRLLEDLGYVSGDHAQNADFTVVLQYESDKGRQEILSYPGHTYLRPGYWVRNGSYRPPYWVRDPGWVETRFVYRRKVKIFFEIEDNIAEGLENHEVIFEATALNDSESLHFSSVMPYMLHALLENFPGKNGVVEKISLPFALEKENNQESDDSNEKETDEPDRNTEDP